jgi:lipoyl-dependent peroxiredoxin
VPRIERNADVTWTGNVARGDGKISGGSGAIELLPFSLATRIGNPEGKTSPEELIAAAVGSCFAMSLAGELTQAGSPPELISVDSKCVVDEVEGSHVVTEVQLSVRARVPGVDDADFQRIAREAEEGCTMAHLVRGSAAVTLSASLETT